MSTLLSSMSQFMPPGMQSPEAVLALTIILAGVIAFFFFTSSATTRTGRSLLITGPCNSGKTTLFLQLRHGTVHSGTVASMQENDDVCQVALGSRAASLRLVDMPGHHSFRHKLEQHLKDADGVVFVVDALEMTPNRTEAAEMLYEILSNPAFYKQRTPLFIACNKMDLEHEAHSPAFITKTLERQLDSMRRTKTAGMGQGRSTTVSAMGRTDKPFAFEGLSNKVTVGKMSALKRDLAAVVTFVGHHY